MFNDETERETTRMKSQPTVKDPNDDSTHGFSQLADLNPDAILDEAELAEMIGRHRRTIRRAVERGELPQPIKLFGRRSWTAGTVLDHIKRRLASASDGVAQTM